jgi:CHAT domain-containing protein/Tfp pilus assembly protein PilF
MSQRVYARGIVFATVLTVSQLLLEMNTRSFGQVVSEAGKTALKECERLKGQSQQHYAEGKLAEAINEAETIVGIVRAALPPGDDELVFSLDWLAGLCVEREDFARATSARQEALRVLQTRYGAGHWVTANARRADADVRLRAGMNHDQRQMLVEADRLDRAVMALHRAGRHADALRAAERALAIRKDLLGERHPDFARSLVNVASQLEALGEYAAARRAYDQALAIRKEVLGEHHPDYARTLNNLGHLLTMQGDYAAARPHYEKAMAIRRELFGERNPEFAQSVNNLAHLLTMQGDFAAARPLYDQALAIIKATQGERHPEYATVLNNLGGLLELQGDFAAAQLVYEQAQAIRKEVLGEHHPAYAQSLHNLASLLVLQEKFTAALALYEQALAIRKEVLGERHPDYATTLDNLAGFFQAQGKYAAARTLYERALAIRKEVLGERHPAYARTLNNLGGLLMLEGDDAGARRRLEEARQIAEELLGKRHRDYATCLNNLALLAWRQKDFPRAASLFEQVLEISERNLVLAAAVQSERQQLAMTQELRGALDKYLSIAVPAGVSPTSTYRHVLAIKGAVFERQRRFRTHRRRLQADPKAVVARGFAEYQETISELARLALATPEPNQAKSWHDKIAELSRRSDALEGELARLDAAFRADEAEASRSPEGLQAAVPKGAALVDFVGYTMLTPPAQGKGEFQRELRLAAFVLRHDPPIVRVDLGPIAPIVRAVNQWRPLLVNPQAAGAAVAPARELRRLIWEPLEHCLDGITSILVSPDGPIGLIPLNALPGNDANRYMIEERSIVVMPVPRMLGSATPAPDRSSGLAPTGSTPSLLMVGDVDYGGNPGRAVGGGTSRSAAASSRSGLLHKFCHLDATRQEILAVRDSFEQKYPGAHVEVLRTGNATESAFRLNAPRHRVLHLATHGYFAPELIRSALGSNDRRATRPDGDILAGSEIAGYHPGLLSGIALTGANSQKLAEGQDDGILTALEVAELDLAEVELAVLSACETGLGPVAGGEGLLGLERAFQVAGARSVVASLWSVSDEATRALMVQFYKVLWTEGKPPAEALREAQLYMLREGRRRGLVPLEKGQAAGADRLSPYYWAAFVLSTDRP